VAKQGICDLEDIKFNFSGQKSDTIINHELKLDCYMKNLTFNRPVVYQIDTSLTILTSGTGNWDKVGTGLYTIDSLTNVVPFWPIVIELQTNKTTHSTSAIGGILWSTFFQNGYSDEIRVNQNNGTQYVVGYTADTHFPTYNGLYNPVAANHQDAFVATFLKNDSQYWATIYGGASADINDSRDYATGVDYDSLGYIYVSGYTYNDTIPTWKSSNPSAYWQPKKKYPLAPGSALPDIFVLKLDSTGNRGQGHPEWCTMIGGYYGESASDLKYYHNRIYIVGSGGQSDYGTPAYSTPLKVETGAYNQDSIGGALIYKLSKDGVMDWGTYFSKLNGTCFIAACDIDKDGGLNITGATKKNGIPTTVAGPNLPFGAGSTSTVPFDAYVAMFDANDAQTYCTYIGGGSWDEGYDIACTGRDTYIVGYTQSSGTYHFPFAYSSGNYIDSTLAGTQDGFICEISHANGLFEYSSLYGGSLDDEIDGVCADSRGNIDVVGTTLSTSIYIPSSFPPTMFSQPYQGTTNKSDAFVGNMANNIFTWLTYFGGTDNDRGKSICAYHDTTISFTGFGALLNNFPVTNLVVCPPCNYYDPNGNIFITKLGIQPIYIGIKELGSSKITNDVLVYPNPALTSVNVRMKDVEKNCKLEIYNAVGQMVYASVMTENTIEINTAHYTDGIYFIKIINRDKIYSGKFVKQ
ncbi:MAG: T9SS type A sorting domain-containing protein, partial [Mucilaginibacter sp.]